MTPLLLVRRQRIGVEIEERPKDDRGRDQRNDHHWRALAEPESGRDSVTGLAGLASQALRYCHDENVGR